MPGPDYIVDIDGLTPVTPVSGSAAGPRSPGTHGPTASAGGGGGTGGARAWIAVKWTCCSAYSRIYKHRDGDRYEGRCPKCMKQVSARVGPGGTDRRMFEAG